LSAQAQSAVWRREHGCTRIGHGQRRSGCPPLGRVREWRCESEVNDANQDSAAGEAEKGECRRK